MPPNLAILLAFLFPLFPFIHGIPFPPIPSPIDCSFERHADNNNAANGGFCGWRPDNEGGTRIWHSGNAVLVDSVNSVVRSSSGGERFAFAQGRFGAPTEGSLRSPLIHDRLGQNRLLRLTYWKASASPSLDICLEEMAEEPLHCVDTIQGPGQQQWVRRSVELPPEGRPYRVVLRARNLVAAEDIIGVDDVQLVEGEGENQLERSPAITGQFGPKNPFEMEAEEGEGEQRTRIFPASKKEEMANWKSGKKMTLAPRKGDGAEEAAQIRPTMQPLIRPQIRLSPSMQQIGDQSKFEDLQRPMPANGGMDASGQFPTFPSFFNPLLAPSTTTPRAPIMERNEQCQAVSCTFMENTCQWELGPGWHSTSHGSTSIESPATSSRLASALFKPPVASFVDFDLWMSDEADLSVVEQIEEGGGKMEANGWTNEGGQQQLFGRSGATDGGWHRFRVPLRPSFSPVRLIFMAQLSAPLNAFISLSNIRLVNSEGAEIGCQSLGDKSTTASSPASLFSIDSKGANKDPQAEHRALLAELGLDWLAKQPAPLQLPTSALGGGDLPFPSPPPFPAADSLRNGGSPPPRLHHQPQHMPPGGTVPFNPLRPMFEGIAPIVPLQGNPPRLTAVMDEPANRQKQNNFPQLLSPLALPIPKTEMAIAAKPMSRLRPMADEGEEGEKPSKFEVDEPNERQQFYGATPIPSTGIGPGDEALLPFQGDERREEEEAANKREFGQKENSELTMLPRRRNKMMHAGGRGGGNEEEDWPNMMEMGDGGRRLGGKKSTLPSSVTSVLASSHHRGWVERAGMGEDLAGGGEFRSRRSGQKINIK